MNQIPLLARLNTWKAGLGSEVEFWEKWFSTRGLSWPDDFAARIDPDTAFPDHLLQYLPPGPARVLDVGAGPMTVLGRVRNGAALDIAACDPLARIYDRIAEKNDIARPTVTREAFVEDLSSFFPTGAFDLVYCQNALDHSFEPVRGIEEMLIVVRRGGYVVLQHSTNEAEHEGYAGLHQWNFDAENGNFIIWNREGRIDVSAHIAGSADISVVKDDRYHFVVMRKTADWCEDATERMRARIKSILAGLVDGPSVPSSPGDGQGTDGGSPSR